MKSLEFSKTMKGQGVKTVRESWVPRALENPFVERSFRVEEHIGHGTFGQVWRVSQGRQQWALKVFKPFADFESIAQEIEFIRDLGRDEANCIVSLAGHCMTDGEGDSGLRTVYMLTPFIPFVKFRLIIEDHLSYPLVLAFYNSLLRALEFIHSRGIVHRDVKPSNFLCDPRSLTCRLIDFGLADSGERAVASRNPADGTLASSLSSSWNGRKRRAEERDRGEYGRNAGKAVRASLLQSPAIPPPPPKKRVQSYKQMATHVEQGMKQRKQELERKNRTRSEGVTCRCLGQACFPCPRCLSRPSRPGRTDGTPGYRAPETLLRATEQGTAVDVWAAGIVILQLLCGSHALFGQPRDDAHALAQVAVLRGAKKLKGAAEDLKCQMKMSSKALPGLDLKRLSRRLRMAGWFRKALPGPCEDCAPLFSRGAIPHCLCKAEPTQTVQESQEALTSGLTDPLGDIPDDLYVALEGMLEPRAKDRLSATDALHDFVLPLSRP